MPVYEVTRSSVPEFLRDLGIASRSNKPYPRSSGLARCWPFSFVSGEQVLPLLRRRNVATRWKQKKLTRRNSKCRSREVASSAYINVRINNASPLPFRAILPLFKDQSDFNGTFIGERELAPRSFGTPLCSVFRSAWGRGSSRGKSHFGAHFSMLSLLMTFLTFRELAELGLDAKWLMGSCTFWI